MSNQSDGSNDHEELQSLLDKGPRSSKGAELVLHTGPRMTAKPQEKRSFFQFSVNFTLTWEHASRATWLGRRFWAHSKAYMRLLEELVKELFKLAFAALICGLPSLYVFRTEIRPALQTHDVTALAIIGGFIILGEITFFREIIVHIMHGWRNRTVAAQFADGQDIQPAQLRRAIALQLENEPVHHDAPEDDKEEYLNVLASNKDVSSQTAQLWLMPLTGVAFAFLLNLVISIL